MRIIGLISLLVVLLFGASCAPSPSGSALNLDLSKPDSDAANELRNSGSQGAPPPYFDLSTYLKEISTIPRRHIRTGEHDIDPKNKKISQLFKTMLDLLKSYHLILIDYKDVASFLNATVRENPQEIRAAIRGYDREYPHSPIGPKIDRFYKRQMDFHLKNFQMYSLFLNVGIDTLVFRTTISDAVRSITDTPFFLAGWGGKWQWTSKSKTRQVSISKRYGGQSVIRICDVKNKPRCMRQPYNDYVENLKAAKKTAQEQLQAAINAYAYIAHTQRKFILIAWSFIRDVDNFVGATDATAQLKSLLSPHPHGNGFQLNTVRFPKPCWAVWSSAVKILLEEGHIVIPASWQSASLMTNIRYNGSFIGSRFRQYFVTFSVRAPSRCEMAFAVITYVEDSIYTRRKSSFMDAFTMKGNLLADRASRTANRERERFLDEIRSALGLSG